MSKGEGLLEEAISVGDKLYEKVIKERNWDFLFDELGKNSERTVDRFMSHLTDAKGEEFAKEFFRSLVWLVCVEKIEYERDLRERRSNLAEISFQALFLAYELPKELEKIELEKKRVRIDAKEKS